MQRSFRWTLLTLISTLKFFHRHVFKIKIQKISKWLHSQLFINNSVSIQFPKTKREKMRNIYKQPIDKTSFRVERKVFYWKSFSLHRQFSMNMGKSFHCYFIKIQKFFSVLLLKFAILSRAHLTCENKVSLVEVDNFFRKLFKWNFVKHSLSL